MTVGSRLIAAALCAAVLVACGRTPPATQALGVTTIAPQDRGSPLAIAGTTLDGRPLSLADLRGNVAVINSWASWCAPCTDEAPLLVDTYEALRDGGTAVSFLGLNVNDEPAAAARFVDEFGIPYPSLADGDGSLLALIPGVPPQALPSTVVLDRQGRIAATIVGPVRGSALADAIAQVSAED